MGTFESLCGHSPGAKVAAEGLVPQQRSRKQSYYYSGRQRIELTPAEDLLAVDEQRLTGSSVSKEVQEEIRHVAQTLRAGVLLVRGESLDPDTESVLEEAGALQPVYRAEGAIIVLLPEVRVEESRPDGQQRLEEWIRSHSEQALVQSRQEGRIVLEPASGHGEDALAMANALAEQVRPEMAQARFLRVVPRPSTMR